MNAMKQYATKIVPMLVLVTILAGGQSMSVSAKGGAGNDNVGVINTSIGSVYGTVDTAGNLVGQGTTNCQNCAGGAPQTGGFTDGVNNGVYSRQTGSIILARGDEIKNNRNDPSGQPTFTPAAPAPAPAPVPAPAPSLCALIPDKFVVAVGTPTIALSWTPTPLADVLRLTRTGSDGAAVPLSVQSPSATSFVDTTTALQPGNYIYNLSYTARKALAVASTDTTIASQATEQQTASLIGGTNQLALGGSSNGPVTPGGAVGGYIGGKGNGGFGGGGGNGRHYNSAGAILLAGGGGPAPAPAPAPAPPPQVTYRCSTTVRVVRAITECNDGIDNADTEDTLVDEQDPGCHTDGNPANILSYESTRTSETNTPADLIAHMQAPMYATAQSPLTVITSGENISPTYASTNDLVYGWRDTSVAPSCTGWGSLFGNRCFTNNGQTYMKVNTFSSAYSARQLLGAGATPFLLPSQGTYEVCAVADYTNVIAEGSSGESNNSACQTVRVLPAPAVITGGPTGGITGPLTLIVSPTRVRRGNSTTLAWDTGGRTKCTITGTNGQTINLIGAASAASDTTRPITAETTYTLSCADDASSIQSKVKLIAQYKEI